MMVQIKNKILKKFISGLLIGISVTLLFAILVLWNPLESLHLKFSNSLFTRNEASEDIVIIAIDDNSTDTETSRGLGRYFDWSRDFHKDVLKNLEESGASVVGFDLIFSDPSEGIPQSTLNEIFVRQDFEEAAVEEISKYSPLKDHPQDTEFAEELNKNDNVVLAAMNKDFKSNGPLTIDLQRTTLPIKPFIDSNFNKIGLINIELDIDNILRRIPLYFTDTEGEIFESFPLQVAQKYTNNKIDEQNIPLENGRLRINYFGKQFAYKYISFTDIYHNEFSPEDVNGKIALIGVTSDKIGQDAQLTPTSTESPMPGVEIHANAIQTILDGKFLSVQSKTSQILTIAALAIIGALILAYLNIWLGIALIIAAAFLYTGLAHLLYKNGTILNMIYPYIAILLIYIGSVIYKYFAELRAKQYVKSVFKRYLSPNVMDTVLKNPEMLHPGGMRREVTVFFSDIAGFTTISEKLDPEHLIELVNEYLSAMTEIVLKHEGTLDKYVGDAIVAYFGAPISQEDHAKRACNVALEMRDELPKLHKKWEIEHKPLVDFRVGINSGDAIVGNVGSENRLDYTIMGDEVNLGSRLEGANKKYGTHIMISESTYERAKDEFIVRELDHIRVKGKKKPVRVYELVARKGLLSDVGKKLLEKYNKGIESYFGRNFKEAYDHFKSALEIHPEDGPSKLYLQRCDVLSDFPPPEDWDGVFTMKDK